MINIQKSPNPPECLEKEKKKNNGNYRCGDVVKRIKEDFLNKCYLCEEKDISSINVEHFRPHRGNKDLKFDWNNLFYACGHCNNSKGDKYDNILDCTNPEHQVMEWIHYKIEPIRNEKVKLTALKNSSEVRSTVQLLLAVYNGTTPLKEEETDNIRKKLVKEVLSFYNNLAEYYDDEADESDRAQCLKEIKKQLRKRSAFTAFKRWIIKDSSATIREELQQYFD